MSIDEKEIRAAIQLLERLTAEGSQLDQLPEELRVGLMAAAGRLSRPAKEQIRLRNKQIDRQRRQNNIERDRQVRSETGIREARKQTVFVAPESLLTAADPGPLPKTELKNERTCYVCKTRFTELHFFYDSMCSKCADFNYQKRFQTSDLSGQTALITGARVKIGYQAALMMLRANARVVVTTRFPVDAAARFAREKDFDTWRDRLQVYGLDLRHTPSVELFTSYIERNLGRLDILINNAAQTVRRPPGFYAHMMEQELTPHEQLPEAVRSLLSSHEHCLTELQRGGVLTPSGQAHLPVTWQGQGPGIGLSASAKLSQIPYSMDHALVQDEVFPRGELDADLQQVDLRKVNSWRLGLADVPTAEMIEVQLVNAIAPFVLCSRLAPLMRRDRTGKKHIVNVTAMEGKFTRYTKTDKHPHTNMAKAALNMMTHTSAKDLQKDGIFMNAVDTGWVTDEDPAAISLRKQNEHDFQPPLDIIDGAARICDPFFHGQLTDQHWCGQFLKDYRPTDW